MGGRKGPVGTAFGAVALLALAFSSLSALKKRSSGDSSCSDWFTAVDKAGGVNTSPDKAVSFANLIPLIPGESGTDLE